MPPWWVEVRRNQSLRPNRDVRAMAALALARVGDTAGAKKLAAELDKTFPLDTLVQRYWLPTIRAGVALEGKHPGAIELLKVGSTIEISSITPSLTICLCPVYMRGEGYLMAHDGHRAAAEFQKFIDHRGVVMVALVARSTRRRRRRSTSNSASAASAAVRRRTIDSPRSLSILAPNRPTVPPALVEHAATAAPPEGRARACSGLVREMRLPARP
jgi:hypothetical protein